MKNKEQIIKDMQEVVYQMKLDDIEENPDSEYELFQCSSCAVDMPLAGSVLYKNEYRLCNDSMYILQTSIFRSAYVFSKRVISYSLVNRHSLEHFLSRL